MSEIKQINTGVAELLAVKVPEYELAMVFENELFLNKLSQEAHFRLNLPPGNWTPLGVDTELTEEQCAELVPFEEYFDSDDASLCGDEYEPPILFMEFKHKSIKKNLFKLETAKEAFASIMQANGCYSVNPYKDGKPSIVNHDVWYSEDQWQQAESNTGSYLILKRLS